MPILMMSLSLPWDPVLTVDDDDESIQENVFQGDDVQRDNVRRGIRSKG